MDQKKSDDTKEEIHTFEDDIASKGGTLDDHGVVFETNKNKSEQSAADIKPAEEQEEAEYRKPSSILSNRDDVFDVTGAFSGKAEPGTIITDKKGKRKSLGAAFVDALAEWSGAAKEKVGNTRLLKEEKTETKVAPAQTRKETIVQASKKATRAPSDDYKTVVQKIRTLDLDAEKITGKPYLVKDREEKSPEWTHRKESAEQASAPSVSKTRLTPKSGFSLIAPEVEDRAQDFRRKEKTPEPPEPKEEPVEEKPKSKSTPKQEHLVAQEGPPVVTPIPKRRSTPSPARKEKARKEKERKKKKFPWRYFFWNLLFGGGKRKESEIEEAFSKARSRSAAPKEQSDRDMFGRSDISKSKEALVAGGVPPEDVPDTSHESLHDTSTDVKEEAKQQKPPEPEKEISLDDTSDKAKEQEERPLTALEIATRKAQENRKRQEQERPKSGSHRFLFIGIVLIATGIGIGTSYFLFALDRGTAPTEIFAPVVSFMPVDQRTAVAFENDRVSLLQNINAGVEGAPPQTTQLYPVVRETNEQGTVEETSVPTSDIFAVLEPRAPSPFIRSLREDMMFGSVQTEAKNEPFIILKTDVFDVAFAGMLDWEPFMSADLSPLFGPPVARTFDESARSADNAINAIFQDIVVKNNGARILYDEENRDRIVYTFIDKETIVITTTKDALQELFDALR